MILASGWGSPSQARRILSGGRSLGRGARSQEDKPQRLYRLPPDSPGLDEPEASQVVLRQNLVRLVQATRGPSTDPRLRASWRRATRTTGILRPSTGHG